MSEGLVPDAIISSDAKRARKTTQRVVEGGELTAPVIFHSTLYLAPPQSYIHVLQQQRDTLNCILMVGHNPGIEELSHLLTGQAHSFPTATLAEIELPLDHWADLELETTATLRNLWRPRELDD